MIRATKKAGLWGKVMPAGAVNLDALIERQDFEAGEPEPTSVGEFDKIFLRELETKQVIGSALRKPWFQRETSMWDPEKVAAMVASFLNKELVPAVILWKSTSGLFFVIDGAHRLSCLLAWVHDDYGVGNKSNKLFAGDYSTRRARLALEAKKRVEVVAGGSYQDILDRHNAQDATEDDLKKARHVASCYLQIQWVPPGDSKKAESSFFKINEQGVPLSETELISLYSRDCPNSIATRGINQFGTGSQHWRRFKGETRTKIERLSREIHSGIFQPTWEGNTISTPELPIAGRGFIYPSLSLVADMVNIANDAPEVNVKKIKSKEEVEKLIHPDVSGDDTIIYLERTKSAVGLIKGLPNEHRALDLYPLVYFYSNSGKYMPTSFLAVVELMIGLDKNELFKFTAVRDKFEEFLIEHKGVIGQVSRRFRGQISAVHEVKKFLDMTLRLFFERKTSEEVARELSASGGYSFTGPAVVLTTQKKRASAAAKSRHYIINTALPKAVRCKICNARVLDSAISIDHVLEQEHGGLSTIDNFRDTHHYCNASRSSLEPYLKKWRNG